MKKSVVKAVQIADDIFQSGKITKEHIKKAKQNDVLIGRCEDCTVYGALEGKVLTSLEWHTAEGQQGAIVMGIKWLDGNLGSVIVVDGSYLKDE